MHHGHRLPFAAKAIDIDGIESFAGHSYHTADWPRDGVDFSGRRVAVIGTGSSAIQAIPIIAEQASELTIFQRTPAFSLPAYNRPLEAAEVRERKANYPANREAARHSLFGVDLSTRDVSALAVSRDERDHSYEQAWQTGTLNALLQSYNDLLVSSKANDTVSDFVRDKIRSIVDDPAVADTLCPTSFPLGTKRACLDTNYYAVYNREHVSLVDLRKTPIERITAQGVKTSDSEYCVDAIVYATGFDAMTGALSQIDIRGRDGISMQEAWKAGPRCYLGLAVAGFPNLFTITGPGSPSVMSNMLVSIEQHVDWITDCLAFMRERGYTTIEADSVAQEQWVGQVNEIANATLFPRANSWYMGANVPGKPQVFMPYIGGVAQYRQECDAVTAAGYRGFSFQGAGESSGRRIGRLKRPDGGERFKRCVDKCAHACRRIGIVARGLRVVVEPVPGARHRYEFN